MTHSSGRLLLLSAAVASLLGCASDAGATKAGGAPLPVTLTIGTNDATGRPAADDMDHFAGLVDSGSGGRVHIETRPQAVGANVAEGDQDVAKLVMSGDLDMGVVASRAWDLLGVTSLVALNAPFVIQSDAVVDGIITAPLATRLMSGLSSAGVVGIALLPEDLRHPFGFGGALLSPDDYVGRVVRTPPSATVTAMFEAFGATTSPAQVDTTTMAGMESAYLLDPTGTAAGNVTFFPKINVLVINGDTWAALSSTQRSTIEQSAAQTRTWAIDTLPKDSQAAATFCHGGGAIVRASGAQLAALQQAAQPVIARLEQDPATKELLDAIRDMAAAEPVSADAGSSPVCDSPGAVDSVSPRASEVNGLYRFEVTDDQLRAAGVNPSLIAENHGVFTWRLRDGTWHFDQQAPNPLSHTSDDGTYSVDGDRISFNAPSVPVTDVCKLVIEPNGDMLLTPVNDADRVGNVLVCGSKWVRIGD